MIISLTEMSNSRLVDFNKITESDQNYNCSTRHETKIVKAAGERHDGSVLDKPCASENVCTVRFVIALYINNKLSKFTVNYILILNVLGRHKNKNTFWGQKNKVLNSLKLLIAKYRQSVSFKIANLNERVV